MKNVIITDGSVRIRATLNDTLAARDFEKGFLLLAAETTREPTTAAARRTDFMILWKRRLDGRMEISAWEADGSRFFMAERKHPENIKR